MQLLRALVGKEGYFMAENRDDEMYSMSYKDARDKFGAGVGSNKYFMSESDFEKGKQNWNKKKDAEKPKEEKPAEQKKQQSLVANKFGAKKEKTWNDLKSEYNNDPAKMADYMNNTTDYTPGNLTKKGMEELGYIQGDDGKWAPKPKTETNTTNSATNATTDTNGTKTTNSATNATTDTNGTKTATTETTTKTTTTTDEALNGVEGITKEDPKADAFVNGVTNEDGSVNEQKALNAMSRYEQKLVEMGAGSFDKDGKLVFKDTTKKGWEDFATMLSVGASVIGIAMGVPIIPINFRKITNKNEKDAKIREFQKQYADIMAGNAAKVEDVNSSIEAGKLAKANEDDINAYSKYKEDVGAYEAKSTIDTDSEKELIETRTTAQIKADEARFNNEMERIKADQNFTLNLEALREKYKEQFAALESALMTGSAKELAKYQNADMFKEMEKMGITPSKLAAWKASQAGISPADKTFNKINTGVNTTTNLIKAILNKGGKD